MAIQAKPIIRHRTPLSAQFFPPTDNHICSKFSNSIYPVQPLQWKQKQPWKGLVSALLKTSYLQKFPSTYTAALNKSHTPSEPTTSVLRASWPRTLPSSTNPVVKFMQLWCFEDMSLFYSLKGSMNVFPMNFNVGLLTLLSLATSVTPDRLDVLDLSILIYSIHCKIKRTDTRQCCITNHL